MPNTNSPPSSPTSSYATRSPTINFEGALRRAMQDWYAFVIVGEAWDMATGVTSGAGPLEMTLASPLGQTVATTIDQGSARMFQFERNIRLAAPRPCVVCGAEVLTAEVRRRDAVPAATVVIPYCGHHNGADVQRGFLLMSTPMPVVRALVCPARSPALHPTGRLLPACQLCQSERAETYRAASAVAPSVFQYATKRDWLAERPPFTLYGFPALGGGDDEVTVVIACSDHDEEMVRLYAYARAPRGVLAV